MDLSGHEGEIPIPITSKYVVHHNPSSTRPLPLSTTNNTEVVVVHKVVRYRECLKNHAASMGGTATDGCGEFMPSGDEGTLEALKCSACSCHRNFHRKEVEGECQGLYPYYYNNKPRNAFVGYMARPQQQPPPALIMPLGAAIHTSESDHENIVVKKRFRTQFSAEQKEKMLGFAERVGWKLQRQEESLVQQLCQEIGIKRRVLKVWMHNNKHNYLAKKSTTTTITPQIQ